MVIGLAGPKLAGKGTVAKYLVEQRGGVAYSMSGILTDVATRLHKPNSRANLIAIVTGLRNQFGEDVLAHVLKQDILDAADELAVIDGIRMPTEVDLFSGVPGFSLFYIDAAVEARYQRALMRGEKAGESDMTFEQFQEEEQAVTEQRIVSLKDSATVIIENIGTIEELYTRLEEELQQLAS